MWTQPKVREHKGNGSNIIRLLMWNPENLAQRLDLDKAVSKGKQTRMNSPPLRSAREEWAHKIVVVDPEFIIYNEASLEESDTKKRNNARKVIREAEEFHAQLDYELIIGFEGRGHASHGGAIAVKRGVIVTDVQYGFNGGRKEEGRVLMIRVATEEQSFNGKQVDGMWIVQMYMHNKGDAQRNTMMKAYYEWKETHGEPVIIGSDTNSIDNIAEDVAIHVPSPLENVVRLDHTLDLETGKPIPNTGLEEMEIFLESRAREIREWKSQCKLQDAQRPVGNEEGHTCNIAWMRWFPYAKKHRKEWNTLCPH